MELDDYIEFGMTMYHRVISLEKELGPNEHAYISFEVNKSSITTFIERLSKGHMEVVNKYGSSRSLDTIFMEEVLNYYSNALNIPPITISETLHSAFNRLTDTDEVNNELDGCLIIYPCFIHDKNGHFVEHKPAVKGFIISGNDAEEISIGDGVEYTIDNAAKVFTEISGKVASLWTEQQDDVTPEEREEIKSEILSLIMFDNTAACREEVLTYLADASMPALKRLLK